MSAAQALPTDRVRPSAGSARQERAEVIGLFGRAGNGRRHACDERVPETGELALAISVLDCLRFGLAVVDGTGRISFANQCLRGVSRRGTAVRIAPDGRLHFTEHDAEQRLHRALADIIVKGSREGTAWTYGGNGQTPDGTVVVRPLNCGAALVILAPRADECPLSGGRAILEAFGLTPAEHRLTEFLASGGRLSEAASRPRWLRPGQYIHIRRRPAGWTNIIGQLHGQTSISLRSGRSRMVLNHAGQIG